jgi:UDP-glucuronate 4-epimerase
MTSVDDPAGVYANNLSSTAGALDMARKCGAKRFIFASSSTVYGNAAAETDGPVGVYSLLNPLNAYAASKIACEYAVDDMAKFAGIDYTILRLFSVYGPGMRSDLAMSKMAKCVADGTTFTMRGDGTTRRDYTYIDDVVGAFVLAATEPKAACMTFNICSGSPVSLRDTIAAVEKAMGAKVPVRQCDETPYDAVATYGDNTLAAEKLGWRPKVGFNDGVTRFSAWFKENETA